MYKVVGVEIVSGHFTDKLTGEQIPYEYHNLHCLKYKNIKGIKGFSVAEIKVSKRVDLGGLDILDFLDKMIDIDIEISGKEVNIVAISIVDIQ